MLEHTLYILGGVELLVTTEITHNSTATYRQMFYKVHVNSEWFRLREDLIKRSLITPEQAITNWGKLVAHKEVQASVEWMQKYHLPQAKIVNLGE